MATELNINTHISHNEVLPSTFQTLDVN